MNSAAAAPASSGWMIVGVSAFAIISMLLAYKIDQPMLIAVPGIAIVAGLFAWSQPFIICTLFIAVSYFRLPEAYEWLQVFKPALLLGIASVGLVAVKALLSELRGPVNSGTLKSLCLLSLGGCIVTAVPLSFLHSNGSVGLDPLLIPIAMLLAAFCAIVWTVLLSSAGEHPMPINIQLFTAFHTLICITTILSVVPGESFDWWSSITWRIAVMTLATAWLVRSEQDIKFATNTFIVSGLLIAAVVIYNKIFGLSLVQGTRVAIGFVVVEGYDFVKLGTKTILSDPNDLALIMMFPLAFALARVVYRRSMMEGVLAAASVAIILSAIIFTQSRGAIIGLLAIFAVLLHQRYKSAVQGLVVVVIAGALLVTAMGIGSRSAGVVDEDGVDESSQHRLDAWKTAINMVAARPLTGIGISNFPDLYYSYTNYWHNRSVAVHSTWFQVLAELGVIGFGIFVAMIWTSFKINAHSLNLLRQSRAPPVLISTAVGLQAALAGTCAAGTFLSQAYTWPIYIIVALTAALGNLAKTYHANFLSGPTTGTVSQTVWIRPRLS